MVFWNSNSFENEMLCSGNLKKDQKCYIGLQMRKMEEIIQKIDPLLRVDRNVINCRSASQSKVVAKKIQDLIQEGVLVGITLYDLGRGTPYQSLKITYGIFYGKERLSDNQFIEEAKKSGDPVGYLIHSSLRWRRENSIYSQSNGNSEIYRYLNGKEHHPNEKLVDFLHTCVMDRSGYTYQNGCSLFIEKVKEIYPLLLHAARYQETKERAILALHDLLHYFMIEQENEQVTIFMVNELAKEKEQPEIRELLQKINNLSRSVEIVRLTSEALERLHIYKELYRDYFTRDDFVYNVKSSYLEKSASYTPVYFFDGETPFMDAVIKFFNKALYSPGSLFLKMAKRSSNPAVFLVDHLSYWIKKLTVTQEEWKTILSIFLSLENIEKEEILNFFEKFSNADSLRSDIYRDIIGSLLHLFDEETLTRKTKNRILDIFFSAFIRHESAISKIATIIDKCSKQEGGYYDEETLCRVVELLTSTFSKSFSRTFFRRDKLADDCHNLLTKILMESPWESAEKSAANILQCSRSDYKFLRDYFHELGCHFRGIRMDYSLLEDHILDLYKKHANPVPFLINFHKYWEVWKYYEPLQFLIDPANIGAEGVMELLTRHYREKVFVIHGVKRSMHIPEIKAKGKALLLKNLAKSNRGDLSSSTKGFSYRRKILTETAIALAPYLSDGEVWSAMETIAENDFDLFLKKSFRTILDGLHSRVDELRYQLILEAIQSFYRTPEENNGVILVEYLLWHDPHAPHAVKEVASDPSIVTHFSHKLTEYISSLEISGNSVGDRGHDETFLLSNEAPYYYSILKSFALHTNSEEIFYQIVDALMSASPDKRVKKWSENFERLHDTLADLQIMALFPLPVQASRIIEEQKSGEADPQSPLVGFYKKSYLPIAPHEKRQRGEWVKQKINLLIAIMSNSESDSCKKIISWREGLQFLHYKNHFEKETDGETLIEEYRRAMQTLYRDEATDPSLKREMEPIHEWWDSIEWCYSF